MICRNKLIVKIEYQNFEENHDGYCKGLIGGCKVWNV